MHSALTVNSTHPSPANHLIVDCSFYSTSSIQMKLHPPQASCDAGMEMAAAAPGRDSRWGCAECRCCARSSLDQTCCFSRNATCDVPITHSSNNHIAILRSIIWDLSTYFHFVTTVAIHSLVIDQGPSLLYQSILYSLM